MRTILLLLIPSIALAASGASVFCPKAGALGYAMAVNRDKGISQKTALVVVNDNCDPKEICEFTRGMLKIIYDSPNLTPRVLQGILEDTCTKTLE